MYNVYLYGATTLIGSGGTGATIVAATYGARINSPTITLGGNSTFTNNGSSNLTITA